MKERITFVEERLSEMSQAAVGQEVRVNDLEATIIRLQHEIESKQKEIVELKAKDERQQKDSSKKKKSLNKSSSTPKANTQQQQLAIMQQQMQLLLNNTMYNNNSNKAFPNQTFVPFHPPSGTSQNTDVNIANEEWQAMNSMSTGKKYFYNARTGESRWKVP